MGKTSTLLGALLLSASGLTAQAQDEVNLTFSRTGSDASGISVNVTDENGEPVSGASATLTLKPNNVLTNGVLTSEKANVICPNQNKNANGSDIEFTISITGLPSDLTFNKVEATTWALTSNGVLQTYAGRYWNLSVQAGTSSDNLTATANLENFDLYNGPGNNTETLATTPSFILSSATSTDASGNLCIKFIANNGTKDPTIGCFIGLESINLSNKSTITFNYVDSKGYTIAPSKTVSVPMGQAYTVPAAPEIAHFTNGTPNLSTIDSPGATETVTYTYQTVVPPFQTSTVSGSQWTGDEHWFTLFTRGTYWVYNSGANQIDLKNASLSAPYADKALWCVADAGNGTYKLYNRAAGPGQALTVDGSTVTMGTGTAMELWYYRQNPDNPYIPGGWCLNVPDSDNFLNKQGDKLTIWNSTGARGEIGSVVGFTDVLSDYADLRDEYKATVNYVGGYSADVLASSGLAKATTVDAYNAAFTALSKAEVITIQPGQYYRIVNELRKVGENGTPVALTGGYANGNVGRGTASSARNVGQLWQFETSDEGYKLRNANYGLYAGTLDGSGNNNVHMPLVDADVAPTYNLTALGGACWKLADPNNSAHNGVMHCAGNNYIVAWNDGKGSGSSWYIVPVTDIEVAMHRADTDTTDTWATLCLPFAVETPDGLTAYTGQADTQAGTVALTEIEDGLVPAGNGVVLKGSAEAYTLAIRPDAEAWTLPDNDLTGTTTAQPLAEGIYVLGKYQGTPGFYLPNPAQTELSANKAYIDGTPALALAAGYRFVLGDDETTGIGSVQTPDGPTADQPCYDLQGRRVGQPRQGGVYIQGGKKVYIRK